MWMLLDESKGYKWKFVISIPIPNKSISIGPTLTSPNLCLSRCPSLCAAACLSKVKLKLSFPMASANRWLRPEVYPLFAAVGAAVGICAFSLVRNIAINPEVRVNKEGRAAGVLENYEEGKKYAEHNLRQFVRNKSPEIMPSLNKFFADPK